MLILFSNNTETVIIKAYIITTIVNRRERKKYKRSSCQVLPYPELYVSLLAAYIDDDIIGF